MPVLSPGTYICTVTGNLEQYSSAAASQGYVIFTLVNIPIGALPRVLGTTIFPQLQYRAEADKTGTFTTQLWGNDQIDPANSVYSVTFWDAYGNHTGPVLFFITGVNFNLDSATPMSILSLPIYSNLTFATGTLLTPGNFALVNWGAGASITSVTGTQQGFVITVTAGTAPSVGPTLTLTYPAAFPRNPMVIAQMVGGTGIVSDIAVTPGTTSTLYTYDGLPVVGKTYIINSLTLGQ
jgi:hypothetical protein